MARLILFDPLGLDATIAGQQWRMCLVPPFDGMLCRLEAGEWVVRGYADPFVAHGVNVDHEVPMPVRHALSARVWI